MWEREHVEAKLLRVEYTQKIAEFLVKNQSQISRFGVDLAGEQDVRKAQERMETEKPPNALWAEMGEMVHRQMEEFFCHFGDFIFSAIRSCMHSPISYAPTFRENAPRNIRGLTAGLRR